MARVPVRVPSCADKTRKEPGRRSLPGGSRFRMVSSNESVRDASTGKKIGPRISTIPRSDGRRPFARQLPPVRGHRIVKFLAKLFRGFERYASRGSAGRTDNRASRAERSKRKPRLRLVFGRTSLLARGSAPNHRSGIRQVSADLFRRSRNSFAFSVLSRLRFRGKVSLSCARR